MLRYLLLITTLVLAGCDTNKNADRLQRAIPPDQSGLMFMYPATGQENVSQLAPIFLVFTHPLAAGTQDPSEFVELVRAEDNAPIEAVVTLRSLPDERGILEIQPSQPLAPNTEFFVRSASGVPLLVNGNRLVRPIKARTAPELRFTTASAVKGAVMAMSTSNEFRVRHEGMVPRAQDPLVDGFPLVDFSTLRVELTQPILAGSARYAPVCDAASCNGTISLRDSNDQHVPARLFVAGQRLVIDPKSDLDPDLTYRLVFKGGVNGLRSQFGRQLSGDLSFNMGRPLPSEIPENLREPRLFTDEVSTDGMVTSAATLASKDGFAASDCTPRSASELICRARRQRSEIVLPQDPGRSRLSGRLANLSPVEADFLGRGADAPEPMLVAAEPGSSRGTLFGEVANTPTFGEFITKKRNRETIPLRVFAGNQLQAEALKVRLLSAKDGPSTPLGGDSTTGELTISLLSDATGFVVPNLYNPSDEVPALVKLFMDVAVTAANPDADGAFTQNILHVEANGVATINQAEQKLEIEAIGVIDIKILGTDDAIAVLSLKLESQLKDSDDFRGFVATPVDALEVVSWVPGNRTTPSFAGLLKRGVNEPGELIRPGDPLLVSFNVPIDPSALDGVVLRNLSNSQPVNVAKRVDGSVLVLSPLGDVPANTLQYGTAYRIELTGVKPLSGDAPLTTPAEPLEFKLPALANPNGRSPVVLRVYPGFPCRSVGTSFANNTQGRCDGGITSGQDADDLIPLARISPERDIEVVFSQSMDVDTINRGFAVFEVNGEANGARVPGVISFKDRTLRFKPEQPWKEGQRYRYVLRTQESGCSGQSICGSNGLPLQTRIIAQSLPPVFDKQRGGANMEIPFVGGTPEVGTVTELRGFPTSDVDANFLFEPNVANGERLGASAESTPTNVVSCTAQNLQPSITSAPGPNQPQPSVSKRCFIPNGALLQPDTTNGPSFTGAATSFALGCKDGTEPDMGNKSPNGADPEFACQGNQFLHITSALSARIVNLEDKSGFKDTLFPVDFNDIAGDKVVRVEIDPTIIFTSGPDIYASLGLTTDASQVLPLDQGISLITGLIGALPVLGPIIADAVDTAIEAGETVLNTLLLSTGLVNVAPLNTGPLVFRMRYEADPMTGNRVLPASGVIYQKNTGSADDVPELRLRARLELYTDIPEINAVAEIAGLPLISIGHKVRSNKNLSDNGCEFNPATNQGSTLNCPFVVDGKVNFLDDGRLTISLANLYDVRLQADLFGELPLLPEGTLAGALKVIVPQGRFGIDASLPPLKDAEPIRILLNQ